MRQQTLHPVTEMFVDKMITHINHVFRWGSTKKNDTKPVTYIQIYSSSPRIQNHYKSQTSGNFPQSLTQKQTGIYPVVSVSHCNYTISLFPNFLPWFLYSEINVSSSILQTISTFQLRNTEQFTGPSTFSQDHYTNGTLQQIFLGTFSWQLLSTVFIKISHYPQQNFIISV